MQRRNIHARRGGGARPAGRLHAGCARRAPSARPTTGWHATCAAATAAAGLLLGCGSIAKVDRDLETHPITDTGVAGTILMPGEGIAMPNRQPHGGLAPNASGQAPAPGRNAATGAPAPGGASSGSASGQGTAAPSGGGMMMIGGASQDVERHQKVNNEPAWAKALKLPFLIAAYPFMKAHQAMTGPPDPTVKVRGPPPEAPPTPAQLQAQRERALLEGMERELAGQGAPSSTPAPRASTSAPRASNPAPAPSRTAPPPPSPTTGSSAAPRSIAEELAALRASMSGGPAPSATPGSVSTATGSASVATGSASVATGSASVATGSASAAAPTAPPPPAPEVERLYESVDRDADGQPDQWIYRTGREVTAEASDEDGDGRAERIVRFVPGTREPRAEEEDTNADGRVDTFTEYEDGVVARRRADTDGDGEVDTWSFYRDGDLLRHEQDTDADGFRDRMSFYEVGRLVREEEDRDGNGRPDRITYYDEAERIARREEDTNRDDVMDVRSFYQEGKLRRREMMR